MIRLSGLYRLESLETYSYVNKLDLKHDCKKAPNDLLAAGGFSSDLTSLLHALVCYHIHQPR